MEKGAVTYDEKTGLFGVDLSKVASAVKDLAHDLLMIEAKGDYSAAKDFIAKYKRLPDGASKALAKMDDVPVDIKPVYAFK
jgi:hypothetical protein